MYESVKQMGDLPEQATDEDIEVRIYGGVWVGLDERHDDGGWNVQYIAGEPAANVDDFRKALGIADGMFAVPAETEVEEVRAVPPA